MFEYEAEINMSCDNCGLAIERILRKKATIENFVCDLHGQKIRFRANDKNLDVASFLDAWLKASEKELKSVTCRVVE